MDRTSSPACKVAQVTAFFTAFTSRRRRRANSRHAVVGDSGTFVGEWLNPANLRAALVALVEREMDCFDWLTMVMRSFVAFKRNLNL